MKTLVASDDEEPRPVTPRWWLTISNVNSVAAATVTATASVGNSTISYMAAG